MKKLILLLLALLPVMMQADGVTEEKAKSIAERFFASSRKNGRTVISHSLRMVWNGENKTTRNTSSPAFYVFNNEGDKGFVIISGDESTAFPVLGYSFEHNFDAEDMPENLRNWMMGVRGEINEVRGQGRSVANPAWTTFNYNDRTPIKYLQTALWDQRAPYNSKLPLGFVTGCPATAIAIIMRYHRWPEKGVGTIPESNDKIGSVQLGHTYDWDNMPLTYNDMPTQYQKDQVGILMRDVGAMVRTQYGGGTAGAKPEETLPQLMPIYMRYDAKTIRSVFKKDFSEDQWHAMMRLELDESRPVLYGGYSSGGGHQFILDGYAADNYYHVNWGWSGVSNGYYLLSVMNPPEQGAGGSSSADGFTRRQDAIIGIQPDPNNPGGGYFDLIAYKPFNLDASYGVTSSVKEFHEGVEFDLALKEVQNKGSRAFRGQIAVAHCALDGSLKEIISSKVYDYSRYYLEINDPTEISAKCTIRQPIAPGDYICGVYKYMNPSGWTPISNGYQERENCTDKIILKEDKYPVQTSTSASLTGRAISTFSAAYPTVPSSSDVEAYWAEYGGADKIIMNKIVPQGNHLVIPANTGVVLSTPVAKTFMMSITDDVPTFVNPANQLKPTNESAMVVEKGVNAYILAMKSNAISFYRLSDSDRMVAAHRAYLELPAQVSAHHLKFDFGGVTGIDPVDTENCSHAPIYDLSGRRVENPSRNGIYIQNGRKFIIH